MPVVQAVKTLWYAVAYISSPGADLTGIFDANNNSNGLFIKAVCAYL